MGGWGWDDDWPSETDKRLFQNARRLYDRIGELVDLARSGTAALIVSPELVLEFHAIATAGEPDPLVPPGVLRTRDVQIGRAVALFEPPPWQEVKPLLSEACGRIQTLRRTATPIHAAAYALWRINAIHPFGDGNGKTSRGVMYAILCDGYGRMLPGEPALPDLIAQCRIRYWEALAAADRAWRAGVEDVDDVEDMLFDLVVQQLGGDVREIQ